MIKTFHELNSDKPAPEPASLAPGSSLFASLEARKHGQNAPEVPPAQPDNAAPPKPVFRPAVHAEVSAEQRAGVEAAVRELKLDDFIFADAEISRILLLQDSIRLDDPTYVGEFGGDLSLFSDSILNRLAEISQSQYPAQIRHYLGAILQLTRKVNLEALKEGSGGGFLKSLFTRGVSDREGFRQIEHEITAIAASCLERLALLKKAQQAFVDLLEKNELQFRAITTQMVAGQLRAARERQLLETSNPVEGDFFARQQHQDRLDALARFERRLHNLSLLRHTVLLRMSQLRLEQKNTHSLIDQTHETITLVIPAWRQQVMALFSAAAGDSQAELYSRLESTQLALQERLQAINADKDIP